MRKNVSIQFLESKRFKPFSKAENVDALKYSLAERTFADDGDNLFLQGNDLRYYWDGTLFGLHIEEKDFDEKQWQKLISEESLQPMWAAIRVLYLSGSQLVHLKLEKYKTLEFLVLTDNPVLESVHLKGNQSLQHLEVANCGKLKEVSLLGAFPDLEKMDCSFGSITSFHISNSQFPKLQYLNLQNNQLSTLDLSGMPALQYVFLQKNELTDIKWPESLPKIEIFEVGEVPALGERVNGFSKLVDEALRKELKEYLKQYQIGKERDIHRVKLIFIGNTNAGKSTLRRILTSGDGMAEQEAKRKEIDPITGKVSTHGVYVFQETIPQEGTEIAVQGFDFGGQDYYHSTHLPFYSLNAINLLVYGFQSDYGTYYQDAAYKFYSKIEEKEENEIKETGEEEKREILYPLTYWLGSLKHQYRSEHSKQKDKKETGEEKSEPSHVSDKQIPERHQVSNAHHPDSDKYAIKPEDPGVNVALVQNVWEEKLFLELNNLALKSDEQLKVLDVVAYNFHSQEAENAKQWLKKLLITAGEKPIKILGTDYALANHFSRSNKILFTKQELEQDTEILENIYKGDKPNWDSTLNFLHRALYGFYFNPENKDSDTVPKLEQFFVTRLDTFNERIHKYILKKDSSGTAGYFTTDDLRHSELDGIKQHLLNFLAYNKVIFPVQEKEGSGSVVKWMAPSYLPKPASRAEELLLESFDKPDCIFEFHGFFHANIMHTIIASHKDHLIFDQKKTEYLLWKDTIILYQQSVKSGESTQVVKKDTGSLADNDVEKAMLLIQMKYPGVNNFEEAYPQLCISRNKSGFVKDSIFGKLFHEIKTDLDPFTPIIRIKTRFDNYIPYEVIFQTNTKNEKERSDLIFHNNVLYSSHDFRHFRPEHITAPTKLFIAYSRHDISYVEELLLHLQPFENNGDLVVFYDKRLPVGEKWDEETRHELIHSDIVLCMVSPHMLNTEIVTDIEIPLAHKHKKVIVPVILKPCNWLSMKRENGEPLLSENNAYAKSEPLPADRYAREAYWQEIANALKAKRGGDTINWDRILEEEKKQQPNTKRISISYAPEDQGYLDEFMRHLNPWIKQKTIQVYLSSSGNQKDKNKAYLNHAHQLICLVSPDFLNQDHAIENDIPLVSDKDLPILPVILKPCNWLTMKRKGGEPMFIETLAFQRGNPLPDSQYVREACWMELAKELLSTDSV